MALHSGIVQLRLAYINCALCCVCLLAGGGKRKVPCPTGAEDAGGDIFVKPPGLADSLKTLMAQAVRYTKAQGTKKNEPMGFVF